MKKCKCGNDLEALFSVRRKYTSLELPSRFAEGHYDNQGDFDPDTNTDLSGGSFDTFDGADTCTTCLVVVG